MPSKKTTADSRSFVHSKELPVGLLQSSDILFVRRNYLLGYSSHRLCVGWRGGGGRARTSVGMRNHTALTTEVKRMRE